MKLFFFLIFTSVSLLATGLYDFHVANETMGDAYWNILNGISALIANELYISLLKLVFTLGGFIVFFMGTLKLLQGGDSKAPITEFTKYMIAGTVVLTLLYGGSKAQLAIIPASIPVDPCNSYGTFSSPPVEMPEILAISFSAMNSIGREMTMLSSSVYNNLSDNSLIVDSLKHSSMNGVGTELDGLQTLLSAKMDDFFSADGNATTVLLGLSGKFGSDYPLNGAVGFYFKNFFEQCVFMPANSNPKDTLTMQSVLKSTTDLKDTLQSLFQGTGSASLSISYHSKSKFESCFKSSGCSGTTILTPNATANFDKNPGGFTMLFNGHAGTCHEYYADFIEPILTADYSNFICGAKFSKSVTPSSIFLLTGSSQSATSATMSDIILNSGISTALQESASDSRLSTDVAFAGGKSTAEFIMNNVGTGAYMSKMLPYLQMGIRAILYAFFPFVFVVILFPGGFAVFKSYAESMLWVELWAPVAAVLNLFMSYFQIEQINSQYANGLNYSTSLNIATDANMLAAVAGYLYMSVPALTWLVLKGSAQMLGGISGGMASNFSKNMSSDSVMRDQSIIKGSKTRDESITGESENQEHGIKAYLEEQSNYEGSKQGYSLGMMNNLGGVDDIAKKETLINQANIGQQSDLLIDLMKKMKIDPNSLTKKDLSEFNAINNFEDKKTFAKTLAFSKAYQQAHKDTLGHLSGKELIDTVAQETGVTAGAIGQLDEHGQQQLLKVLEATSGTKASKDGSKEYLKKMGAIGEDDEVTQTGENGKEITTTVKKKDGTVEKYSHNQGSFMRKLNDDGTTEVAYDTNNKNVIRHAQGEAAVKAYNAKKNKWKDDADQFSNKSTREQVAKDAGELRELTNKFRNGEHNEAYNSAKKLSQDENLTPELRELAQNYVEAIDSGNVNKAAETMQDMDSYTKGVDTIETFSKANTTAKITEDGTEEMSRSIETEKRERVETTNLKAEQAPKIINTLSSMPGLRPDTKNNVKKLEEDLEKYNEGSMNMNISKLNANLSAFLAGEAVINSAIQTVYGSASSQEKTDRVNVGAFAKQQANAALKLVSENEETMKNLQNSEEKISNVVNTNIKSVDKDGNETVTNKDLKVMKDESTEQRFYQDSDNNVYSFNDEKFELEHEKNTKGLNLTEDKTTLGESINLMAKTNALNDDKKFDSLSNDDKRKYLDNATTDILGKINAENSLFGSLSKNEEIQKLKTYGIGASGVGNSAAVNSGATTLEYAKYNDLFKATVGEEAAPEWIATKRVGVDSVRLFTIAKSSIEGMANGFKNSADTFKDKFNKASTKDAKEALIAKSKEGFKKNFLKNENVRNVYNTLDETLKKQMIDNHWNKIFKAK